jgi:hypothetical protein
MGLNIRERKTSLNNELKNHIKVSLSYLLFSVVCLKIEQKMFQVIAKDIFCLIFAIKPLILIVFLT